MLDKVGEDEYNSQCCREGRERERAAETAMEAILENDIEKEEQKEQSDSERVRNAIDRLAPVGGEGLNIRV